MSAFNRVFSGVSDYLFMTESGTVSADAFAGITGIEWLVLHPRGNDVTLPDSFVAGSDTGYLTVFDGGAGASSTVRTAGVAAGRTVYFYAGDGNDLLMGGAGSEVVLLNGSELTAADTFLFGSGGDWLIIQNAGTVSAAALVGVAGVEVVSLSDGGAASLRNGMFGDVAYGFGSGADDTFDASLVTDRDIGFLTGAGADTLLGGSDNDTFIFLTPASELTAGDRISGGTGYDALQLWGGTLAANALTKVTGIELFSLVGATSITLLESASAGGVIVEGSAGNDLVDASSFTGVGMSFSSGGGTDIALGGLATDVFTFRAADIDQDAIFGGNGTGPDYLVLEANGTYTLDRLVAVREIEEIQLRAGGSVQVNDGHVFSANGWQVTLRGSVETDTLDASFVTDARASVVLDASASIKPGGVVPQMMGWNGSDGGDDVLRGGAGDDLIKVPNERYALADGGGGFDVLRLTEQNFIDLSGLASHTADIEALDARGDYVAFLLFDEAAVTAITGGAGGLYVMGAANIQVSSGWTLVEHDVQNDHLPGVSFDHFSKNGISLFSDTDLLVLPF